MVLDQVFAWIIEYANVITAITLILTLIFGEGWYTRFLEHPN